MKTVTLGGDRIGAGKKMKVQLHGFERSTHDLGYVWRNTQAPGTLVPFMVQLALPGDTFDINLGADVKTHPTLGPLFASFKLQLDVFECPIRLYHAWLHNNKLKIGNDMSRVKLPQLKFENVNNLDFFKTNFSETEEIVPLNQPYNLPLDQQQINPSCIFSYLGLRGLGWYNTSEEFPLSVIPEVNKNAIPYLAYWDIYKNYYSNKQEEIGAVIHYDNESYPDGELTLTQYSVPTNIQIPYNFRYTIQSGDPTITVALKWYGDPEEIPTELHYCFVIYTGAEAGTRHSIVYPVTATGMGTYQLLEGSFHPGTNEECILTGVGSIDETLPRLINKLSIETFNLENIDHMRENILAHNGTEPFFIDAESISPYGLPYQELRTFLSIGQKDMVCVQEGLAIKTYQSDIFNNWLNNEWIDGEGGINEITAINTESGSFDIDTLNLAQKVYDMLNRIAVSDGSYKAWLEAVYDHESYRTAESPIYHGGLSKEIIFQEVINQAANNSGGDFGDANQPLGTLAGKGGMAKKHKGGQVYIKVQEPSYIIGIVSITPRIDYSQGNDFFTTHQTMNDLHKPSLDEIGFQDLVTDKMAFWDTTHIDEGTIYNSAGKQPAWLDYMTNYNRLYGNFAIQSNEMYMTLARNYESEYEIGETPTIKDLTTYIDPTKFNYAFAQTDLSAMNFWVQIGVDITARRKMSAKLMPNL